MNDARLAEGLVERLVNLSLVLRNDPGVYTHYPCNGASPSIIDLTFTQGQPNEDVLDWLLGDDFGSDHLSTHLHFASEVAETACGLAWSKAVWGKFVEVLD